VAEIDLVTEHERLAGHELRGGEIAIDERGIRRGLRRAHRDQLRDVGGEHLRAAATVRTLQRVRPRLDCEHDPVAASRLWRPAHAIPADGTQAASPQYAGMRR